jgi:toxin ParE1/3/4
MGQIIQTPEARDDIAEIWLYIALTQDNQPAADQLLESINGKLILISNSPYLGQAREEVAASLRIFPVGKYILFYRPISGGIELVRVMHGTRDIQNLF